MTTPQTPIKADYQFKSATIIGQHVTQVAVDGQGEYHVATSGEPLHMAAKLRQIAAHIEHLENSDA